VRIAKKDEKGGSKKTTVLLESSLVSQRINRRDKNAMKKTTNTRAATVEKKGQGKRKDTGTTTQYLKERKINCEQEKGPLFTIRANLRGRRENLLDNCGKRNETFGREGKSKRFPW